MNEKDCPFGILFDIETTLHRRCGEDLKVRDEIQAVAKSAHRLEICEDPGFLLYFTYCTDSPANILDGYITVLEIQTIWGTSVI